jgi:VIT1/CCC1 family predicted Fe2+/Mn2+ transporter
VDEENLAEAEPEKQESPTGGVETDFEEGEEQLEEETFKEEDVSERRLEVGIEEERVLSKGFKQGFAIGLGVFLALIVILLLLSLLTYLAFLAGLIPVEDISLFYDNTLASIGDVSKSCPC